MKFFGGLSVEETATALKVSTQTVLPDWSLAKAWLRRETAQAQFHRRPSIYFSETLKGVVPSAPFPAQALSRKVRICPGMVPPDVEIPVVLPEITLPEIRTVAAASLFSTSSPVPLEINLEPWIKT
jgi:hypothetical protein